jgi:hypothetical protein
VPDAKGSSLLLASVLSGVGMEREPLQAQARKTDAREHHSAHHGGDRLSRVDVVFEVASQEYSLDERAATLIAENLRVKAAHEPGAEGTEGARAVAVFYALNAPTGGGERPWALFHAVKRLHDGRPRPKN